MTSRRRSALLALSAAAISIAAASVSRPVASTLVVSVGEVGTGAFIREAQVRVPSLARVVRTPWNGEARFTGVPEGRYRVQVRAIGYAPGDIDVDVKSDTASVHFELEKVSAALDTVRVSASRTERNLREFESRRAMGIGRFVTDSMIVAERARSVQMLLVSHVPGLKVVSRGVKAMEPATMLPSSARQRRRIQDGCPVAIYLDGFEMTDPEVDVASLEDLRLDDIAGIESYTRNTAPAQYKPPGNYCKVILLWTKW